MHLFAPECILYATSLSWPVVQVGHWGDEHEAGEEEGEGGEDTPAPVVEYEVEFSARKIGLRFRNAGEAAVVRLYEGAELQLHSGGGRGRHMQPRVVGARLVGVNGRCIEHLPFNDVTSLLARAGRPIRMRFREELQRKGRAVRRKQQLESRLASAEVGKEDPGVAPIEGSEVGPQ